MSGRRLSTLSARELEQEFEQRGIEAAPDLLEAARRPETERVGLGFVARYERLGIELHFGRLRDSRGDLSAELTVKRYGAHQFRARVNLSSGPARASTARYLEALPRPKGVERVDYREVLEMAFLAVLDLHRGGDPIVFVGSGPISDRGARRLIPPLPLGRPSSIIAPWGAGKSTLGAAIIATCELGLEVVPGWSPPPEPVHCLILDWESDAEEWNDRLARIAAGVGAAFGDEREPQYRQARAPLDEQIEQVAEIVARSHIGFVLIDSAEKAIGSSSGAETYGDRAGRLFAAIDQLDGATTLILDHISGDDMKRSDGRPLRKAIGSTMKGAWSRAVYELKRERDPDVAESRVELVLHTLKVNDGPPPPPFELAIAYDDDAIRFERTQVTAPDLAAGLSKPEQMARALSHGAMPVRAVADALDATEAHVRSILSKDRGRRFVRLPDGEIGLAMPR